SQCRMLFDSLAWRRGFFERGEELLLRKAVPSHFLAVHMDHGDVVSDERTPVRSAQACRRARKGGGGNSSLVQLEPPRVPGSRDVDLAILKGNLQAKSMEAGEREHSERTHRG